MVKKSAILSQDVVLVVTLFAVPLEALSAVAVIFLL